MKKPRNYLKFNLLVEFIPVEIKERSVDYDGKSH